MSNTNAGPNPKASEELARFEAELAECLLREGDLADAELRRARAHQARSGSRLTTALLDLGLVCEERIRELRIAIRGAPGPRPSQEELISEGSFQAIYQSGEAALPPSGRSRPLGPGEVRAPVQRELPPLEGAAAPAHGAGPETAGAPRPAEPRAAEPAPAGGELELSQTVGQWSGAGQESPLAELAEVRALLAQARDQRQLGWVLARHALGKAPRVVVLTRRGRAWVGWAGAGPGIRSERVERLVVPPVPGTLFGLVANTGGHYLGPLAEHPVHERFFQTLEIEPAEWVGLFPVHHEGRIEMALYLDAGPGGRLAPDVGEVLLVAQEVPRALARLEGA